MVKQGLTDLERGKYYPGGNNQASTVRVRPDVPSEVINADGEMLDVKKSLASVEDFNYLFRYLQKSSGSGDLRDQNVVGSLGSPVNFEYTFLTDAYLRRLDFVMASSNLVTYLDYGLISGGLTNGVQMLRVRSAVETEIFNAQRFIEFAHYIDDQLGQVELRENETEGFVIASVTFTPIWKFLAGDKLVTRIRDDLSKLRYHRTSLLFLEPI